MTPDSTLAVTKTCPKDGVHLYANTVKPLSKNPGALHYRQ